MFDREILKFLAVTVGGVSAVMVIVLLIMEHFAPIRCESVAKVIGAEWHYEFATGCLLKQNGLWSGALIYSRSCNRFGCS